MKRNELKKHISNLMLGLITAAVMSNTVVPAVSLNAADALIMPSETSSLKTADTSDNGSAGEENTTGNDETSSSVPESAADTPALQDPSGSSEDNKDTGSSDSEKSKDTGSSDSDKAKDTGSSDAEKSKDTGSSDSDKAKDTGSSDAEKSKDTGSSETDKARTSDSSDTSDTGNSKSTDSSDTGASKDAGSQKDADSGKSDSSEDGKSGKEDIVVDDATQAVIDMIAALTDDSTEEDIRAAIAAYEELAVDQKDTVYNYDEILKPLREKLVEDSLDPEKCFAPDTIGLVTKLMPVEDPDKYGFRTKLIEAYGFSEEYIDFIIKEGGVLVADQNCNITKHPILYYVDKTLNVTVWVANATLDTLNEENEWFALDFDSDSEEGIPIPHGEDETDENEVIDEATQKVIDMINALTEESTMKEIREAGDAYDALTDEEKASVKLSKVYKEILTPLLEKLAKSDAAVKAATDLIAALTDKSTDDEIKAARDAYDAQTEEEQSEVTNYETILKPLLEQAETDEKASAEVIDMIDKLDENAAYSDLKKTVDDARAAYDALTEKGKAKVSNYTKLTDLEKSLKEKEDRINADKAAAAEVEKAIDSLGDAASDDDIRSAWDMYNNLTDDQKAYINSDKYEKIKGLIQKIENRKQTEADQAAADTVSGLIRALTEASGADEINAAKDAYDKLTDAQKSLISEEDKAALDKFVASLNPVPATEEDQKAAADVSGRIEALTSDSSADEINAVNGSYNSLTDAQKALVSDDDKNKLKGLVDALNKTDPVPTADEDRKAAADVSGRIEGLTSDSSADDINAVNSSYNSLTDAQKALVSDDDKSKLQGLVDALNKSDTSKTGDSTEVPKTDDTGETPKTDSSAESSNGEDTSTESTNTPAAPTDTPASDPTVSEPETTESAAQTSEEQATSTEAQETPTEENSSTGDDQ